MREQRSWPGRGVGTAPPPAPQGERTWKTQAPPPPRGKHHAAKSVNLFIKHREGDGPERWWDVAPERQGRGYTKIWIRSRTGWRQMGQTLSAAPQVAHAPWPHWNTRRMWLSMQMGQVMRSSICR